MKPKFLFLIMMCLIEPTYKKDKIDYSNTPIEVTIKYEIIDYFKKVPLYIQSINPLNDKDTYNVKIYQDNELLYEDKGVYEIALINKRYDLKPFTNYNQETKIDFYLNYTNGSDNTKAQHSFIINSPNDKIINLKPNERYYEKSTHYAQYIINKNNLLNSCIENTLNNVMETSIKGLTIDESRYYDMSNISFSNVYFESVEEAPKPEILLKIKAFLSEDFIYENGYTIIPLSYTLEDEYSSLYGRYIKNAKGHINNDFQYLIDKKTGQIRLNDTSYTNDDFLPFFFQEDLGKNVEIPFILSIKSHGIDNRIYEINGTFNLSSELINYVYRYKEVEEMIKDVDYA